MKEYKRLLDEFIEEERLKGKKTEASALKYRINRLIKYLRENDIEFNELRVKEAQGYQGWLIETGRKDGDKYTAGSIINFIKKAVVFYDFLKKKGLVYANPFKDIKKIRVPKKVPRNILKEKEMNIFLEALSCFDKEPGVKNRIRMYRVHVISELMYSTGLRVNETASLKEEDVDFSRGVIELRSGKGGKARTVFLNEYASGVLRLYTERIRTHTFRSYTNKELLFGVSGKTLCIVLNRELKRKALELGLSAVTSHGFRHAFGFHLLRAGCDIRYIQELLGHSRIKDTEVYTRVEKQDLKAVLDKYHPRQFMRKA